jgi:hypothetical protein
MKEIDHFDKEVLRAHIGKPLLGTTRFYHGERKPCDLQIGILTEPRENSFWMEGPYLKVRESIEWPHVYTIMGIQYIPVAPRIQRIIPDLQPDPHEFRLYVFDSDTLGHEIIEKITRLENIPSIT